MMLVYLVRHGVAVPRGSPRIRRDADRPLTEEGMAHMRQQARGLAAVGCEAKVVLTSRLLRARQTAEIVRDALGPLVELVETDALGAKPERAALVRLIAQTKGEAVVLVGHEPFMSEVTSWLLTGSTRLAIDFKKGGVCRLAFDGKVGAGKGRLEWLLPPKVLRALRRRK